MALLSNASAYCGNPSVRSHLVTLFDMVEVVALMGSHGPTELTSIARHRFGIVTGASRVAEIDTAPREYAAPVGFDVQ